MTPGRLALLVACTIAVIGGAAASALTTDIVGAGPSSSRVAADRACPPTTPPEQPARPARLRLRAHEVGRAAEPTSLALYPGSSGDGVLGEREGRVRRVEAGNIMAEVVIDLSDDTTGDGDGGLLALAYDPDGRWLYVYRATHDRDDEITAHRVDRDGRPTGGSRVILHVDHPPSEQHHGGAFQFGPDGMLYVGFGDGGGLGDPGENAQDPGSLLGKILRIDPTPDAARPYAVPSDNPFVGRMGWRPEIWVLGVRNPFRLGLDEATGDLWLGDVGQSCWEELDRLPTAAGGAGGANLGWDRLEGDEPFEGGDVIGRQLRPTLTYAHAEGWCAITAGYVVRGPQLPALDGRLLHADYCRGGLFGLDVDHGTGVVDLGVDVERPIGVVPGPRGLPWVLSLEGGVYELAAG